MVDPRVILLLALLLVGLVAAPTVFADEDEEEDEWEEDEAEASDLAEGLGELAAWGGGILTLGFVAFREAFPRAIRAGLPVPRSLYRHVLRLHAATSLGLGGAAIAHGYMLRQYAGPVEYALVAVIVFTLVSGVILWFSKGKVRMAARMIHIQRALSIAIIVLLLIHVATIDD